jgi:hypothetical protein
MNIVRLTRNNLDILNNSKIPFDVVSYLGENTLVTIHPDTIFCHIGLTAILFECNDDDHVYLILAGLSNIGNINIQKHNIEHRFNIDDNQVENYLVFCQNLV